jgi:2-keto-4-pentenoate hydratase/2-oxohepta-3-ene-1,7-dioic acid hydratase in catechol pathway
MRYLTFEVDTPLGPQHRAGVRTEEGTVVDLNLAYRLALVDDVGPQRARALAGAILPPDLLTIIANGAVARDAVARALEFAAAIEISLAEGPRQTDVVHPAADLRVLAPIVRPPSLRDCSAYEEHVRNAMRGEVPPKWYDIPAYYKGNPDSVVGTGADIPLADVSNKLDYELEYAVVVGKDCVDLTEDQVLGHLAGFMVFNDISARDLQFREMSIGLGPAKGKDLDGSNVLGPCLVTPEEWDPHDDHTMIARVNGDEWSRGSTSTIYHSMERIVSYISHRETLHVGDVIGTGTVGGGCGLELGRYPAEGDVVELEIDGLGVLTNRWVTRQAT